MNVLNYGRESKKITEKEAWRTFTILYIDNCDVYVTEDDIEDIIETYEIDYSELRVYGTSERKIQLDAYEIIDNACEELHDDSNDNCDVRTLQKLLDDWCYKQDGTTTYILDFDIGVKIIRKYYDTK